MRKLLLTILLICSTNVFAEWDSHEFDEAEKGIAEYKQQQENYAIEDRLYKLEHQH